MRLDREHEPSFTFLSSVRLTNQDDSHFSHFLPMLPPVGALASRLRGTNATNKSLFSLRSVTLLSSLSVETSSVIASNNMKKPSDGEIQPVAYFRGIASVLDLQ